MFVPIEKKKSFTIFGVFLTFLFSDLILICKGYCYAFYVVLQCIRSSVVIWCLFYFSMNSINKVKSIVIMISNT